jgi:hypothetical protein
VPLADVLPINKNVSSATENTMVSLMGSPKIPLTTKCQNARGSDIVKALAVTQKITDLFSLTGLTPALESAKRALDAVFKEAPELKKVLSTEGMLCTRFRKPTSGKKSTKISNHSWGTAIDFKIVGFNAPGSTGNTIPRFVAIMLPHFNKEGWFSGIAFHDTMHFEVSEELIRTWSKEGKLSEKKRGLRKPKVAARPGIRAVSGR